MLQQYSTHALFCLSVLAMVGCGSPQPEVAGEPGNRNDPARFLSLRAGEDLAVIDAALTQALGEEREVPPTQDTAFDLLRYVAQTTRLEYLGAPLGSACLAAGHGYCMDMAQAFVVLCRRVGIPARVNAFHNFEWMMAHNGAEVFLDGQWRFMDPTYGVFVRETSDENASLASLEGLLADASLLNHAFMVSTADHLWTGEHAPEDGLRPLARDFRYGTYDFNLAELYAQVQSQGTPVLFSELDTAIYPAVLEWDDAAPLQWGTRNGDPFDMLGRRDDGSYPRFRGWPFLGAMRHGFSEWEVRLPDTPPGAYVLQLDLIQHRGAAPEIAEAVHAEIRAFERQGKRWIIRLHITGTPARFRLRLPEGSASFDALRFQEDDESS